MRWSPRWRRPAARRTTPRSPSLRRQPWRRPSATALPAATGASASRPAPSLAATRGAKLGHWIVGRRHRRAHRLGAASWCAASRSATAIGLIVDLVGTGVASQESVPAAFAVLEVAEGDPWQAAVISANLGGDTDTIGAIAAGMAGACAGFSRLPQEHIARLGASTVARFARWPPILSRRGFGERRQGRRGMSGRLVHVGSAVVDYVYRIDALPPPGTEKTASSLRPVAGGGFNMMVAAAAPACTVVFGGQHGTGPNGDFLRAAFAAEGIDDADAAVAGAWTAAIASRMISGDAERTFVSWPGAESVLSAGPDLRRSSLAAGDWVFTSGYTLSYPGSRDALAGWIEALPADISFRLRSDAGRVGHPAPHPVAGAGPHDLAELQHARKRPRSPARADVATVRRGCWPAIARMPPAWSSAPGEAAASCGCATAASQTIPGFKVAAVDTNGAGDTHIGAFVSALARGVQPFEAARYANAAAAISVTRHGGSSAPTDAEIHDFPEPGSARRLEPEAAVTTAGKATAGQTKERNEHGMTRLTAMLTATAVFVSALALAGPGRRSACAQLEGLWRRRALGRRSLREGDRPQGRQRLLQFRTGDADQAQDQSRPLRRGHDQRRLQRPGDGRKADPADRHRRRSPNYADISPDKASSPMLNHDGKVYRRAVGLGPDRARHQRQVLRRRRRPASR